MCCLSMKFIDFRASSEVLYPAMEDFEIDILIGHGPAAKSVKR